jgi:23S rRNA (uracil1939-C5)-methyltransferase
MPESIFDRKARVRPPRVHITYEVETGGAMVLKEIPFVMGVLADLSGQPAEALAKLKDRKFVEIDRDNFDEVLKSAKPRLALRVDRGEAVAPERVAAPCPVFGACGGCQLQHMEYAAQLAWKTDRMRALLTKAGFFEPSVRGAIGCNPSWNYRNHMRFSVNREGRVGLTARGTSRVLPLTRCDIAAERINDALTILARHELPRPQALVRYGVATGQMLLQPTPSGELREEMAALGVELRDQEIEEELAGQRFRIRPSSFFQTNTAQANVMARLALEALPSGSDATLVDAYCGVGTFARLMAKQAGRILAIEESESAIRDARTNLADAPNVEIVKGKVETILPGLTERLDGLVIDPPRAGRSRPASASCPACARAVRPRAAAPAPARAARWRHNRAPGR